MKVFSTFVLTLFLSMLLPSAYAQHHGGMGSMHKGGGTCWKASLSEGQQEQLKKLKLEFKKIKLPLKAEIKKAKVELAVLTIADKPDLNAIDAKVDEITKLKTQGMKQKARHKMAVRNILDDEQRVNFDMKMLKKAYHGKRKGHHK